MKSEKKKNVRKRSSLDRLDHLSAADKKKLNIKVQESFIERGFPQTLAAHTQRYIDIAEELALIPPLQ